MKFTIDWLKQHLETKYNDQKIIDKLTNIGIEVESFENQSSENDEFVVAKINDSLEFEMHFSSRETLGNDQLGLRKTPDFPDRSKRGFTLVY